MSKATDLSFRVVHLPASLRQAIQRKRDATSSTNEDVVRTSIDRHLPNLVNSLQKLGFGTPRKDVGAVRLPFSDKAKTLDALRHASNDVKIPVAQLLEICLAAETSPAKRGRRRSK